jgi:photosystem II stability/assembly factor-like uncharacterized protein
MRFFTLILIIFISFFGLFSCSLDSQSTKQLNVEGSFGEPSLPEQEIFEIKVNGETLYAGTDNNLYLKSEKESAWQPLGLPAGKVRTFVVLSEQELLASVNFNNGDSLTIARTNDGGKSWNPFRNGYGGNQQVIPFSMDAEKKNPAVIFARSAPIMNVARSINGGTNWESVVGTWNNPNLGAGIFVKIDSNNPQNVWAGGANAFFQPSLFKSENGGDDWKGLTVLKNTEATIHDLLINPNSSDQVIIGLGGILKTTDNGESWEAIFKDAGIYTLTHSARDPEVVYGSGVNALRQLFFIASNDFGDSWQTIEYPESPTGIRINDMISVMQNGKEVLYFGTNKGVYSFTFDE